MAIPSPDLVVSFFSNAAQALGLLTVTAGGVAVFRGRRPTKESAGYGITRSPWRSPRALGFALVFLIVALGAANIIQWSLYKDAQNQRLGTNLHRSSTENGSAVGDANLKTLSYSGQMSHPLGITTDDLAELLRTKPGKVRFIDIREPEERETGKVRDFTNIRFPDFLERPGATIKAGERIVLLCNSGNRSWEASQALAKKGIASNFVIGGFEKWRAEGRPVSYPVTGAPSQLRAIPDFPNKDRLLDTPEVHELVEEHNAIFVDVRYPSDFKQSHLPDAFNIPVRKLPTPELQSRLDQLPQRPVIAACYDRRSCFYGQILGLKLHRFGHEFLGRYSVPHEYVPPSAAVDGFRPHVKSWLERQDNTLITRMKAPLVTALNWLGDRLASLALAIILMTLAMRALMAPFTVKADRDGIVERAHRAEIKDMKDRLRDEPQRLARAMKRFYRDKNLRPVRNLIGIAIQIPLFLVVFSAVSHVAGGSEESLAWIPALGDKDPYFALPLLIGLTTALIVAIGFRGKTLNLKRKAVIATAGVILTGLTAYLAAGSNLYLLTSLTLMLGQSLIVKYVVTKGLVRAAQARPQTVPARIVPLAKAEGLIGAGNKAHRLATMIKAGLPVPRGFVIPWQNLGGDGAIDLDDQDCRRVRILWHRQFLRNVAVRSSALCEDGAQESYAGVFTSVTDVRRDGLMEAIATVHASLGEASVEGYGKEGERGGGVIVQDMVAAEYAGVLFTEHPSDCGAMLVEMVAGACEAVANGTVTPMSFRFGRHSGGRIDDKELPIDLAPLLDLGRKIETLFGAPQDIEWAYRGGRFHILQARDITNLAREDQNAVPETRQFERERKRILEMAGNAEPSDTVFAQSTYSELLPRPTPLSLSVLQRLWEPGGSRSLACEALNIPYEVDEPALPMVTTLFGALYVNKHEENMRFARGPNFIGAFRLSRSAEIIEEEFRGSFLPQFLRRVRESEAMDFAKFDNAELLDLFDKSVTRFVRETYVHADVINIAANFYLKAAEGQLERRELQASTYLSDIPETVVQKAMNLLRDANAGKTSTDNFIEFFGHRAPVDYELAEPRYGENPERIKDMPGAMGDGPEKHGNRETPSIAALKGTLALAIHRARRFQALKEEAKHHCLREFAVLRRILLEIDRRFSLGGGIFYLTLPEVARLKDIREHRGLLGRIKESKAEHEYFATLRPLPSNLTLCDLETLTPAGITKVMSIDRGDLAGLLVAGSAGCEGIARVIEDDGKNIHTLQEGEILIARHLRPEWAVVLPRAGAIVTEVGGWLSHGAILAREFNLTMVVDVENVTYHVSDGDTVEIKATGQIEVKKGGDHGLDDEAEQDAGPEETLSPQRVHKAV